MTGDESLRRRKDFQRLYEHGSSFRSRSLVLIFERSDGRPFRVGVVASRKVGNAVERNRAKRWLREAHRHARENSHLEGVHLVLIARRASPSAGYHQIRDEVSRLYEHAGLLVPPLKS
jgi:ribonuclease P protein component